MEEWNKKTADKIRRISDDIEIPEELRPEAVEKMLQNQETDKKPQYRRFFRIYGGAAAAAMAVLVIFSGLRRLEPENKEMAVVETTDFDMEMLEEEAAVEEETAEEAAAGADLGEIPEEEPIKTAKDYKEIYDRLTVFEETYRLQKELAEASDGAETSGGAFAGGVLDLQSKARFEAAAEKEEADYSVTNVREEGVDEADITKTDGEYIYTAAPDSSAVQIIRAGDLSVCAIVEAKGMDRILELYVEDGRLTILSSGADTGLSSDGDGLYYSEYRSMVTVAVYDISDPENPRKQGEITQEGEYRTSRKAGDYLYLFTDCWKQKMGQEDTASYIPQVNGRLLDSDCIYLPGTEGSRHYLLISSVDLNRPTEVVDTKGVLCDSSQTYISSQHIYLTQIQYKSREGTACTEIFKFRFFYGKIWAKAIGLVPGSIKDSFCIDEYNGDLRVVTAWWDDGTLRNGLYVLDEKLELLGSLENLAPGEELKSVRLMGPVGYVVTFRQTDPLFCVDLGDPGQPSVLGELKVSGFSSYLHPYGDGKLLGMGQEADENTGRVTGCKLSMFDVSSSGEMKELDKVVFKDINLADLYDYRAVLADPQKNIIGVCLEKWDKGKQTLKYRIYRYDEEEGFVNVLDYDMVSDNDLNVALVRGIYIKDTLYVTSPREITAFSMKEDYKKTAALSFGKDGREEKK